MEKGWVVERGRGSVFECGEGAGWLNVGKGLGG